MKSYNIAKDSCISSQEIDIQSEKIKLDKWDLDIAGYSVHKGNKSLFIPPSGVCDIETKTFEAVKFDNFTHEGILKIYKNDNFFNGQDVRVLATVKKDTSNKIPEMAILFVCDGHGDFKSGKICAIETPFNICSRLFNNMYQLLKNLFDKEYYNRYFPKDQVDIIIKKTFLECDNILETKYPKKSGGTTCTLKWFILDPIEGNLHIYDITLGDSPSLTISLKNNKVKENTFNQNCDSQLGVKHWLDTQFKDSNTIPPEIVLARFNTKPHGNLINSLDFIKDKNGKLCKIPIYNMDQKPDKTWNLTKSKELKSFYDKCPQFYKDKLAEGGYQTIRDKPQFKKDYLNGHFPTYNFGNTVEGFGQNLGVFGDFDTKKTHKLHCVPVIKYTELSMSNKDIHLIGSDGAVDIHTDDNILLAFSKSDKNYKNQAELYCRSLIKQGNKQAKKHKWKFSNKLGTWDDQSVWIIVVNKLVRKNLNTKKISNKKKKREKRKKRRRFNKKKNY